jgi:hypothetical protein
MPSPCFLRSAGIGTNATAASASSVATAGTLWCSASDRGVWSQSHTYSACFEDGAPAVRTVFLAPPQRHSLQLGAASCSVACFGTRSRLSPPSLPHSVGIASRAVFPACVPRPRRCHGGIEASPPAPGTTRCSERWWCCRRARVVDRHGCTLNGSGLRCQWCLATGG